MEGGAMLSRARKEKVYYTATVYSLCSIYSAIQSPSELACTSHTCAELCSHSANMDPLVSLDYVKPQKCCHLYSPYRTGSSG